MKVGKKNGARPFGPCLRIRKFVPNVAEFRLASGGELLEHIRPMGSKIGLRRALGCGEVNRAGFNHSRSRRHRCGAL